MTTYIRATCVRAIENDAFSQFVLAVGGDAWGYVEGTTLRLTTPDGDNFTRELGAVDGLLAGRTIRCGAVLITPEA